MTTRPKRIMVTRPKIGGGHQAKDWRWSPGQRVVVATRPKGVMSTRPKGGGSHQARNWRWPPRQRLVMVTRPKTGDGHQAKEWRWPLVIPLWPQDTKDSEFWWMLFPHHCQSWRHHQRPGIWEVSQTMASPRCLPAQSSLGFWDNSRNIPPWIAPKEAFPKLCLQLQGWVWDGLVHMRNVWNAEN